MTDNTEPTIQPIQSHTEILIQQAYDRGYADKAMKVDQAIEMEHSAKGCTRKCHTEPTIDDIEQEITNIFITIDNYGTDEEARVDIRKLISDQVAKARIDSIKDYADALIDLFVNPPVEVGAAEDIHLHPWQIKNMILESLNHLDELNGVNNNE